jgi:hypothetical protein
VTRRIGLVERARMRVMVECADAVIDLLEAADREADPAIARTWRLEAWWEAQIALSVSRAICEMRS